MTTSDGGNVGIGGTLTDVDTVGITVSAVNDAPVNTVPASISVTEDVASPISGISINDVDAGSSAISVTLGVPAGTLAATSGSRRHRQRLGHRLARAQRHPERDQQLHRCQRGHLHHCGQCQRQRDTDGRPRTTSATPAPAAALTDVDTVTLNIAAVNDAPVNTVPGAQTTTEDTHQGDHWSVDQRRRRRLGRHERDAGGDQRHARQ